jgi:hypothetical protein
MPAKPPIGKIINGWTILKQLPKPRGTAQYRYRCRHTCGAEFEISSSKIGKINPCGCPLEKPPEPQKRAPKPCQCHHEVIGGKRWFVINTICEQHSTFKENPYFAQNKARKQSSMQGYFVGGK